MLDIERGATKALFNGRKQPLYHETNHFLRVFLVDAILVKNLRELGLDCKSMQDPLPLDFRNFV